ncbi:(R)-stereoselective amidase [Planctomycetes bacterium Pan216]|uniref:(R)-stereoselective amidase n=1 Tax=Kolteria novifilia TaxID=2527975 RepID=A0A518B8P3_9BACT|nr:(R)-stereoselective amidase [Planctomycetes bacterium Pan216]
MTVDGNNFRSSVLRVACAQIDPTEADIEQNLGKHFEYIDRAKAEDVDLLVFPELSLTGYQVRSRTPDLAITREDRRLIAVAERAGDMTVVAGFVEEGYAAQFHNSAAAMRRGKVTFIHRKLNLATYGNLEEAKYFARGRYVDVCHLEAPWTAGIFICADSWNPGLIHLAALYGATILVVPIASSREAVGLDFSNPDGWNAALTFYSMMYGMPIVMVNHCGARDGETYWGGSRVLDPRGKTITIAGEGEELVIADVDYDSVRQARFQLPTVRDSNLDLIHREIERLNNRIGVPRGIRSA